MISIDGWLSEWVEAAKLSRLRDQYIQDFNSRSL